ncbi:hypothetical protein L1887_53113 [Cichorium endivia]|nr:hypothetical protein L1887_53113 [Cichorium endivia]
MPLASSGLGRRIGFGHQHIAIGQHIQPARVIQAFGERCHLGARGGGWLHAIRPANGWGDIHGGDQGLVGLWQLGRRAGAIRYLQGRAFSAGSEGACDHDQ